MNKQGSALPFHLRAIRAALRRFNTHLSRPYEASVARRYPLPQPDQPADLAEIEQQLRGLDLPDQKARAYFEKHLARLARTVALVPHSRTSGRILELGCYMQITPFLQQVRGYGDVRGADYGLLGHTDHKTTSVRGKVVEVSVELFDAERDRFPYDDGAFETVLACELIEHLLYDPMHFLLECRRILEEGGRLLVTTPNVASLTSVVRALHGFHNPQFYSKYTRPQPGSRPQIPHVREYTAFELQDALEAAGFEIETIFTESIAEWAENLPLWNFLDVNNYNTSMRGEQTYCVAIKRSSLPVDRYPAFLYTD